MEDTPGDLNARIAERVRELRAAHALSLDALAARSGVSRSMISLVERGESSPTAVVLEKLAAGLGVTMADIFDGPRAAAASGGAVARLDQQPLWRDPGSGYVRRNVSPAGVPHPRRDERGVLARRALRARRAARRRDRPRRASRT